MKVHSYLFLLILFISLIGIASAEIEVGEVKYYQNSKPIILNALCQDPFTGTYCNTHTCTIDILYSNGSALVTNQAMTQSTNLFNYELTEDLTGINGVYTASVKCESSSGSDTTSWTFIINQQGKETTTAISIIYIILFVILIGFLGFTFYLFLTIPFANETGQNGEILRINYRKHLKILMFVFSYLSFIAITYFSWNIAYGLTEFKELGDFLFYLYQFAYGIIWPLILVSFVISIVFWVRDQKYKKYIQWGLNPNGG